MSGGLFALPTLRPLTADTVQEVVAIAAEGASPAEVMPPDNPWDNPSSTRSDGGPTRRSCALVSAGSPAGEWSRPGSSTPTGSPSGWPGS